MWTTGKYSFRRHGVFPLPLVDLGDHDFLLDYSRPHRPVDMIGYSERILRNDSRIVITNHAGI